MKKQLNLILLGIFLMPSVAFCKTNNFVELGEFIKLFMISKSEAPDWDIGAGNTRLPIKWITDGVKEETDPESGKTISFRDAIAAIKVNGKIVTQLHKKVEGVFWNIRLQNETAAKFSPTTVNFGVDDCPYAKGCEYNVEEMLTRSSIQYKKICAIGDGGGGNRQLYSISFSNKKGVLSEWYTCGSAGCSTLLSLIYDVENNTDVKEICSHK